MKNRIQIDDYIIEKQVTIAHAMEMIEKNSGISLLICEDRHLIGCISDGDIRRFIMREGDINSSVIEAANMNPRFVEVGEDLSLAIINNEASADELMDVNSKAKNMIVQYGLEVVPVVDENKTVIFLILAKEQLVEAKEYINIPVVIMAGGKGTRLAPYTQILPKPLIPIGTKTITEHIMDRFEEYGCKHFDLILNYKKEFIKAYFTDEEKNRDVDFIDESKFMGTAGGLALVKGKYTGDIFISNCDILIEADYADIVKKHREEDNIITVVCAHKKNVIPYGTVEIDEAGQIVKFKEKPVFEFLTNTGMYLIKSEFLEHIPEDTFIHITDVIEQCINDGERVGTYCIEEDAWMDMGQIEELERMRARIE